MALKRSLLIKDQWEMHTIHMHSESVSASIQFFLISCTVNARVDGWRTWTCDFTSHSTVFQSYQDRGRVIMKGVCNETMFTIEKISASCGTRPIVQ